MSHAKLYKSKYCAKKYRQEYADKGGLGSIIICSGRIFATTVAHVPKDHLIGELNKGFKIAMKTLDESRLNVAAMGVGLAQRVLDESIAYAKERKQFGKPIAAIGAIQTKIADIAIDVESTRQLVYHAAELIDADGPFELYSCMAKCRGADIAVRSAIEGIQIFGGYGYSKEYPMEKLLRDSKIFQIYEGTCPRCQ